MSQKEKAVSELNAMNGEGSDDHADAADVGMIQEKGKILLAKLTHVGR